MVKTEFIQSRVTQRQKFIISDSRGQYAKEDNDNLDLSLPAAKAVGEFEERLGQLQRLYIREGKKVPETTRIILV